jgi:LysM repeat protein
MNEYERIKKRFSPEPEEKQISLSYRSAFGFSLAIHIIVSIGILCALNLKARAEENIDTQFLQFLQEKEKLKVKPNYTKTYIVKKGDTIGAIARKYHLVTRRLLKLNNIKDEDKIKEGQTLRFL